VIDMKDEVIVWSLHEAVKDRIGRVGVIWWNYSAWLVIIHKDKKVIGIKISSLEELEDTMDLLNMKDKNKEKIRRSYRNLGGS